MNKLTSLFLLLLPLMNFAQVEVAMNVNQPPEFGFQINTQEITITTGTSATLGSDVTVFGGSGEYNYQWSPSKTLDNPSILNPVATPTDTTIYVLTVLDKNGCSFSLDYTVNVKKTSVGVLDAIKDESELNIILYPNPNDGLFNLNFKGRACKEIELVIVDNNGRQVYNNRISNFIGEHTERLQLDLKPGAYFISVYYDIEILKRQFMIY